MEARRTCRVRSPARTSFRRSPDELGNLLTGVVSVTVDVRDPVSGFSVPLAIYRRKGRTILARIPAQNFPATATPRRLQALAAFGDVASRSYGEKMTGPLPPAAERVQREFPIVAAALSAPRRSRRAEGQAGYRELIGPASFDRAEALLKQLDPVTARSEILERSSASSRLVIPDRRPACPSIPFRRPSLTSG